jgi:hypothetical protein
MLLLIFAAFKSKANDTLTWAQLYDFNVGDTFDYRETYYYQPDRYVDHYNVVTYYSRVIIKTVYYSSDSSTKYIVREQGGYSYPHMWWHDTLVIHNLMGSIDTLNDSIYHFYAYDELTSDSLYFGHAANSDYIDRGPESYGNVYARSLGVVVQFSTIYYTSLPDLDTVVLIYYSNGTQTVGTPYTYFVTGTQQIEQQPESITVFPAINNGQFNVKISDASSFPVILSIYDAIGRLVKEIPINDPLVRVSLESASSGVYLWRTTDKENFSQQGKIIVR